MSHGNIAHYGQWGYALYSTALADCTGSDSWALFEKPEDNAKTDVGP